MFEEFESVAAFEPDAFVGWSDEFAIERFVFVENLYTLLEPIFFVAVFVNGFIAKKFFSEHGKRMNMGNTFLRFGRIILPAIKQLWKKL